MRNGLLKISVVITLAVIAFSAYGKKRDDSIKPYLETRINHKNIVEGQLMIYEVVLHSPDPNIAGVELFSNPHFDDLPATRSAADNRLAETEHDGRKYYSVVVDRLFIAADAVGKHKLKGGEYKIGYNRQMTMQDPFWGPYVANRVEAVSVTAPDVDINIVALPEKGKPDDYSGAVGDYEIDVEVASGKIYAGEEAVAIVTISGSGDLSNATLPDVKSIFNDSLQFHSMTDNRSHYVKDGDIASEIEIECRFVPQKEGDFELGECSFTFYNPDKKKYERIMSERVNIEVEKFTSSKDSPPQYMDI